MIYQVSVPVEILNVKIDVSFKCRTCGSVIRKLTVEKEVARCNKCQSKTKACLEACKMKVNVIHSQNYFEVELNSQTITQFVKNLVKSQGKSRSEWMNINYWPTWRDKKVELVLRLKEEKWSCIGIMELEEDFKPVPNPQIQEANGRISGRSEDIGFEDREVKVEEVEEPIDGPRQMEENTNVQGEEGREKRHEIGDGMRVDEAVVRSNQRRRGGERERPVSPNIEDVEFEEDAEHRRIPEDFDDGGLRGYDDMDMDYDDFEEEEGEGRKRNLGNRDLDGEDDMDMDLDLGRNNRDKEGGSHDSTDELEESDSDEGEECDPRSGEDSDSEQESQGDDEDEEEVEDDSDEEPEQKQTKRRSAKAVTLKTGPKNVQLKKKKAKEPRRKFSVNQKKVLNDEFKRKVNPSKERCEEIGKKVRRWFRDQRYLKKNPEKKINRGMGPRNRYNDNQTKILNRAFEVNQNPNKEQREPLLAKTGLTDDQVRGWFWSRRDRLTK
ncbi:hypothetical protein GCK72_007514 [Caenorhabditis remanei]|uniref:Homeobox domain-containing protein n=1 Tax=Caenorhabditis remanei TaxID=31234 RepID=A0A6A5HJ97_CAERE|nr:hypothetical protein GCK72_007514 [Caenorhabditis remanei]KAF1767555.1 hypothetical protein GCK72_007514 [Caenorhabditis remanei]